MQNQQSLLVLTTGGVINHVLSPTSIFPAILTIASMTDFNVVSIAGRAYITPFATNASGQEVGISGEFLYVYLGAGVAARKAAGVAPSGGALVAAAAGAGFSDLGFHIFAVVAESDTGYLTALGPAIFGTATSINTALGFDISNIPVVVAPFVKKWIVATKAILNYNGNQDQYQFFFVPGGDVAIATTTKHVDFYDIDLLEDASHLIDNFASIPAGVGLCTYHGRLVITTFPSTLSPPAKPGSQAVENISIAYVSHPGEPEAIDQVDGLLIVNLDGNPITNCQEFRDNLYIFKKTRTVGYSDNQDVPSTWQSFIIDEGVGAPVHGIGTVLDSGGVNVDFLLVADYSGIMLFNGAYTRPELSWKIRNFWFALDRSVFRKIELINDSISEILYCILPTGTVLVGNYQNGLNPKEIRWSKWTYDVLMTSLELIDTSTIILGSASGLYKVVPGKTTDKLTFGGFNIRIPDPLIQTAFTDVNEGENINHYTAIRLRVNGTGNLLAKLYSLQNANSQTLVAIPMSTTTDRQLTRLANFQTQRCSLELKTVGTSEIFKINRIILYTKEVFADFPM